MHFFSYQLRMKDEFHFQVVWHYDMYVFNLELAWHPLDVTNYELNNVHTCLNNHKKEFISL